MSPQVRSSIPITAEGCWAEFRKNRPRTPQQPILFLDRDGVLVEEKHHLSNPELVSIYDGAADLIAEAQRKGWIVGLVTNQSGIARGFFGWREFSSVQNRIDLLLKERGISLDFVLACPFHRDGKISRYAHPSHKWRKPNPGMLVSAINHYSANREMSAIVGDQTTDILAGSNAAIGAGFHVLTGHGVAQSDGAREALKMLPYGTQCSSIGDPEIIRWLGQIN